MPLTDQQNDNKFLTNLRDLSTKIKYVFNHKSVEEIYLLYVEGEFLRIIDEDFFTLLRIPEAINTGDSINHYDYNTVNHWISAHPKFVIPFLIAAATVGVARVIQVLSSTAVYPETIGDFLTLIRNDAKEANPEHSLDDDLDLLNSLCNELGIPYYYMKGTSIKQIRKLKSDNRSFFAKLFIKPTLETSDVEFEPLVEETHDELVLCKKDDPIKPITEEPQNKPKPNWFERTWQKIENSKFVEFVITPPWKAANRAAYVYWILWFGAVIVSAIMTGGLVLTATGTVTVTAAALSFVICVPAAVGLIFWGHELINKIWPKKKAAPEIELNDLQKKSPSNVVTNRAEKDSIFSLIGKALALKIHTKQQQDKLANTHRELIAVTNSGSLIESEGRESANAISANPHLAAQLSEGQNKPFIPAKGRITWQSFFNFCAGYVISTFGVWFLTSAITAFAIKFGAMAVATALSATVVGIPLSLLISFSVGITAGGIFAISGGTSSSVAQKEKEAFLMEHPELRPEKIAQQETDLKSLQQKLKTAHQKHTALVEQYNLLNQKIAADGKTIACNQAQQNLVQPLPILSKLNYRTLKNTNSAYTNTNQSKFSKVCDYILTAIGNAGRMGYITRSLMIGGMITILAVTFLHPLGFLTGPIAIAVAVGISGILFGTATVVDRYYEQQRAKDDTNNLRLRLLEVNEKNKLKDELNYQSNLLESHNKTLETQIAQKQKIVDEQEKQLTSQSGEEKTNKFSFSTWKNWIFNSNNQQGCKAAVALEQPTAVTGLLSPVQST